MEISLLFAVLKSVIVGNKDEKPLLFLQSLPVDDRTWQG